MQMKSKLSILFLSLVLVANHSFAQDENNLKNFRFGLRVTPAIDWLRPDEGKAIEKNGVALKFSYGLMMEFRLNKVISFVTGVGGDYDGGKLTFKDSAVYYVNDGNVIKAADTTTTSHKWSSYKLDSREYKVNYVNIPIMLKMKTPQIGAMTYFGLFGGDLGIRTKAKAIDGNTPLHVPSGATFDNTDVDITKDMNLLKLNLNVGAGFEYNLAGSTSLVVSVNYKRGFISALKSESEYIVKGKLNPSAFKQTALLDGLALTCGILF